jgi:T5orf172 domain
MPTRDRSSQEEPVTNPDPKQPGTVYVIGSPESTLVKIGYSAHPPGRIAAIQTMSPLPLELLWQTPGSYELESALHSYFESRRKRGEWFDFGAEDPLPLIKAAVPVAADAIHKKRLHAEREAGQARKRLDRLRAQRLAPDSDLAASVQQPDRQPTVTKQATPVPKAKTATVGPGFSDAVRTAGERIAREARERGEDMGWAERWIAGAEAVGDTRRAAYWRSIKETVDQAPPLGPGQIAKLRILLRPDTADPKADPSRSAPASKPKAASAASRRLIDVIGPPTPAQGRRLLALLNLAGDLPPERRNNA